VAAAAPGWRCAPRSQNVKTENLNGPNGPSATPPHQPERSQGNGQGRLVPVTACGQSIAQPIALGAGR
jgi:hypothetical protein